MCSKRQEAGERDRDRDKVDRHRVSHVDDDLVEYNLFIKDLARTLPCS